MTTPSKILDDDDDDDEGGATAQETPALYSLNCSSNFAVFIAM